LSDEAVHAISAELRNDPKVKSINLRGNVITNDGCKAIASILSDMRNLVKHIDLRENRIGRLGIKAIVEALERSDQVSNVHLCKDGRIEAYGKTESDAIEKSDESSKESTMTKICLVDLRNNDFDEDPSSFRDDFLGLRVVYG